MSEIEQKNSIKIFEDTFKHQMTEDGEVGDQPDLFKKKFGDGPDEWPIEAGRYRLIWMPGCPHAHKVMITRKLLGLDSVISLGTTGLFRTPKGWVFSEDPGEVDPVLKIHYLHDIYTRERPDYEGRSTVPIIVDTVTGQGANNDHFWIPIYLETAWKPFHKKDAPDLYPESLQKEIDVLNKFIFERVNKGVYRVGFSRTQKAYDISYDRLFEALDFLDEKLSNQRFLFGDYITDSDVRLYPTLARFDVVYNPVFHCNRNRLEEFKNLWSYARDLYQTEGFKDTTDFLKIKTHYQLSPHLRSLWGNTYGILAKGPDLSGWDLPSERELLSKDSNHKFGTEQ